MNIGVLFSMDARTDVRAKFEEIRKMDLQSCQVSIWDCSVYTDEHAALLRTAARETGIEISALWAGWSGPAVWDFIDGPLTLGLVPPAFRGIRLAQLEQASNFAEKLGVTDVITHAGFLPENPNDPDYMGNPIP